MATPQENQTSSCPIDHHPEDDPPKVKWWLDCHRIRHKGFWFKPEFIEAAKAIRAYYTPFSSDIILASFPKTGTTWLKALTTSIISHNKNNTALNPNSTNKSDHGDLLEALNPHEVIPFLEIETFGENPSRDIAQISSPRVFNTHLTLSLLPETVKTSGCRVIYITRHPADTFVSLWHLYKNKFGTQISIQEAFDEFCRGFVPAGPYFEHVLEFWQASREEGARGNVLFVTYEDLKANLEENVKRIAEFLGCSSVLENCDGEVKTIVRECSFERLSTVEANKGDREEEHWSGTKFGMFYRRGVVGDWKNHLNQEMVKELEEIAQVKWAGSGLDPNIFGSQ